MRAIAMLWICPDEPPWAVNSWPDFKSHTCEATSRRKTTAIVFCALALEAVGVPLRAGDAFFALLTNPATAPALAPNAMIRNASQDGVFASRCNQRGESDKNHGRGG